MEYPPAKLARASMCGHDVWWFEDEPHPAYCGECFGEKVRTEAQKDKMQTLIEKLPVYADTGKPFIPGRDHAYIMYDGLLWVGIAAYYSENEWVWLLGGWPNMKTFLPGLTPYSTKEAAEEATECSPQSST